LKICLLGYRSNPYSGGQGIYIRYLSKALVDAGHQVDVISGPPYPILDDGVHLIKLPSLDLFEAPNHVTAIRPRHFLSFTDFFEWFSMFTGGFPEPYTFGRRLVRHFKKEQPNYDVVHDNQSLCYGLLTLQNQGVPVLATIHHPITSDREIALVNAPDWQSRMLIRRWHNFLGMQKKVVKGLNHVVTVSQQSQQDISSAFKRSLEKIEVIHNGIDTEVFIPKTDIQKVPFRIMATASADQPLKGVKYLIRAMKRVTQIYPKAHLVILGKLNEDGEIAKLIKELELDYCVEFISGIDNEALVDLYNKACMVVVPSIYEGFGLPAGEAMACGLPVISTNGGALPEVVGDAGIIVPIRDSDAITDAIIHLFENPAVCQDLAVRARTRILEQFSWQVAAKAMVKKYTQVIEQARIA
jgi:glycosyltransferase involved in cell wall biosynthesis